MQTPGTFKSEVSGFGLYQSGDGVFTVVDAETGEIWFRCQSFDLKGLEKVCAIVRRCVDKASDEARLAGELAAINRLRAVLLLDPLTEV